MKLSSSVLLRVFDNKELWDGRPSNTTVGSHVSSLTGVIGEDLLIGLFKHYIENKCGGRCDIVSYKCREDLSGNQAKKLDVWLRVADEAVEVQNGTLYKTEIKNWSASSLWPRYSLAADANHRCWLTAARKNWLQLFPNDGRIPTQTLQKNQDKIQKVTRPMLLDGSRIPIEEQKPLLLFWFPVHPDAGDELKSFYDLADGHVLSGASVFSGSNYLRSLGDCELDLHMPRAEYRMRFFDQH